METATAGSREELLRRARAGQSEALGELCALYDGYLRHLAREGLGWRLREQVEVSDVVQDTMLEIVRQFPQFTGRTEAHLIGWMRRLVHQRLADLGRYHGRVKRGAGRRVLSLEAASVPPGADVERVDEIRLIQLLAADQPSPGEAVGHRESVVLLAEALASLPAVEAEVVWLHHADGLSFEAIGERLGLSRKAAYGLGGRALKALRRRLLGPPGGGSPRDRDRWARVFAYHRWKRQGAREAPAPELAPA